MAEKLNLLIADTTSFLPEARRLIAELAGDNFEVLSSDDVSLTMRMLVADQFDVHALIMSPSMYDERTTWGSVDIWELARRVGVGSIAFMTGLGTSQFESLGVKAVFDKSEMGTEAEKEKIRRFLQGVKS